ncbi:MAG: transcription termination factor Rho [Deltaproteobacteria bacterium]|nr:transcription termination factor Rho [Deltaproteobacteria bacterium]
MEDKKSLEKHTVKELREMALAVGGISGVSAMKKEELTTAIKEAKGVPLKAVREKPVESVVDLKKKCRELRVKRDELKAKGDRLQALYIKRKISKLKKRMRRLARKVAPPGE